MMAGWLAGFILAQIEQLQGEEDGLAKSKKDLDAELAAIRRMEDALKNAAERLDKAIADAIAQMGYAAVGVSFQGLNLAVDMSCIAAVRVVRPQRKPLRCLSAPCVHRRRRHRRLPFSSASVASAARLSRCCRLCAVWPGCRPTRCTWTCMLCAPSCRMLARPGGRRTSDAGKPRRWP